MSEMPRLTLTPDLDKASAAPAPAVEVKEIPGAKELTVEEMRMVEDFSRQIDLTDTAMILQYGAGAQQKMASFSEKTLSAAARGELGEIDDILSGLVTELRSFDADEEKSGIRRLFKKGADKIEALKIKYNNASENIAQVTRALEQHQMQLMKDISTLDQLYETNLDYYKEITMYILAGKKSLEAFRSTELAQATAKAQESGLPEDAQRAKDLSQQCVRFEKKLSDLEMTRMIAIQTAPQIRLIQNNDSTAAEKIQTTLVHTIPLWKSQMLIALGTAHSNEAIKAQRAVSDMTNELLKKNAQALKMATVETAKESERGIVDMETLKETNSMLISTLDEVLSIQEEGRAKRREAETELARIEGELKDKLLEISGK